MRRVSALLFALLTLAANRPDGTGAVVHRRGIGRHDVQPRSARRRRDRRRPLEYLAGRSVRRRRIPELRSAAHVRAGRPGNDSVRPRASPTSPSIPANRKSSKTAKKSRSCCPTRAASPARPARSTATARARLEPETGSPVSQPAGSKLPFSPYYFPDVVRNADGSLTGYFDYRPKDADEAITVARSTDNGKTWVAEGKALEQNPGYCPTADTNDDGQGHPYVASIAGATKLYTLQRPAGDYEGVGLLVHNVEPSAANPLATLPASRIGRHRPQHVCRIQVEVPAGGAGVEHPRRPRSAKPSSPEHIVAGPYEDYNAASPSSRSSPALARTRRQPS